MRFMTSLGLDLSDLGLEPDFNPEPPVAAPEPEDDSRTLILGSVLAKALHSVWTGNPVTLVNSPPGAGKTWLVSQIVAYLKERSELKIIIGCPTKNGAYDLAVRIESELGPDKDGNPQIAMSVKDLTPPPGVAKGGSGTGGRNVPVIRTIASLRLSSSGTDCDLMIIDEAYQATFADVAAAADHAQQVLFVGDPGQIGPVVTVVTDAFRGKNRAPHMRAPEVFSQLEGAAVFALDTTYRLGQETVDAISCLYDFPFTSSRPDRYLTDAFGNRASEIVGLEIPVADAYDSLPTMEAVARYAADLVGTELVEFGEDGLPATRPLKPKDVAVVVSHNAQENTIQSILESFKIAGITVGTADKLQGGQWHAVVALDPLVGYTSAGTHQLAPGRLCVMASRHMTHLTWVHQEGWEDALTDPDLDQTEAMLGIRVRRALTAS